MKISPPKFFFFLTFVSLVKLSFLMDVGEIRPSYDQHACTNSSSGTPLTPNTTCYSNLNLLLSYLTSNSTLNSGFYQTTVKTGTPDAVTGLFLCRGDITTAVCRECVANASKEVLRRCPSQKRAIVWYDVCLIRYEDRSGFETTPGIVPSTSMSNNLNVTEPANFNQLLAETMDFVANGAANSQSGKKFATKEEKFSTRTLYSLAQCTPDLSATDCNTCLRSAISFIPSCCYNMQGGAVLLPSCFLRYELYVDPFYNANTLTGTGTLSPPLAGTSIVSPVAGKSKVSPVTIVVVVVPIAVCLLLLSLCYCLFRWKAKQKYNNVDQNAADNITTTESIQFNLATIEAATNKFSGDNKLGEGGFGEVYKGILPNGQEIAVKRLSKSSGQGAVEFKNEVELIAKLQHKNLVRLFGFCLEGEENILVYEYVANKSLDYFLFDSKKQGELNWSIRCNIIEGIARGILYLHEDSRLKIIHRDLKASNILLDRKMIPKVSDFGLAKKFGTDQTQGNTIRIVGTYGYMAPEYAMEGLYSVKSDVFSFGVLLFEILCGRKNTGFHLMDCAPSLVAYVWQLWNEEKCLDVMDSCLKDLCDPNEFMRYVHIGLLCVQEDAYKRPTMSSVSLMLKSEAPLPHPDRPAFFASRFSDQHEILSLANCTPNEMTVSEFVPR